jgi:hypothetical protein
VALRLAITIFLPDAIGKLAANKEMSRHAVIPSAVGLGNVDMKDEAKEVCTRNPIVGKK